MSMLDKNIAANLKRIRKAKNMSLDRMAEQTGVSKSMLGQIERGESNPTVSTIGKIIEGIKVPLEELIEEPRPAVSVIPKSLAAAKRKPRESAGFICIFHMKSTGILKGMRWKFSREAYIVQEQKERIRKNTSWYPGEF